MLHPILLLVLPLLGASLSCKSISQDASPLTESPALTTTHAAMPQDPVPVLMQGMVEQHNQYRAEQNLPPMVWSSELAQYAQKWVDHLKKQGCDMRHRPSSGVWAQQYGENIYWSKGFTPEAADVVDSWASEKEYFDYKRCNYNNFTSRGKTVGHYTQIMWRNTQRVGCAMARCGDEQVWVCNYDPSGNWVGEKPY